MIFKFEFQMFFKWFSDLSFKWFSDLVFKYTQSHIILNVELLIRDKRILAIFRYNQLRVKQILVWDNTFP